jgi:ABC-type phosphate/phosphonate transport system permease subunit
MNDFDASGALSKLLDRVSPPTAILWVAALAAFIIGALKAPPTLSNGWLVIGALLFFVACGLYCWRERNGPSISNVDDPPESLWKCITDLQWGYIIAAAISFLLAFVCGYLLWSGGTLPHLH